MFDRSREIDLQLFSSCLLRGQRHNDNNFSISPHRKNSVHSYPVCPRPVLTWISTHRKSRRFASFPNPDNVFARAVQRTKAAQQVPGQIKLYAELIHGVFSTSGNPRLSSLYVRAPALLHLHLCILISTDSFSKLGWLIGDNVVPTSMHTNNASKQVPRFIAASL